VKINKDTEAEKIACSFKLAEDKIKYQMIMADEFWSSNRKAKSEKTYRGLVDKIKEPSLKLALKRITLYAQRERTAGFEKEAEEFVNKYPDDPAAEYLLWILAREMLGKNDNKGALACLEKALSIFPNGIYSAQIRFWTHKILPRVNRPDEVEQILTDLVIKNPDSYYMWNAVLNYKDKHKPEDLKVLFEKAVNAADARKALFYNAILFFHDGDFDSRDARIGNMRKFGVYEKYTELESVIRGLKVDSQHEDTLRGIEKYFAIGYAGGINRETALIPDNADSQRSKYIAFSHYGARYGSSFHALTGTLKLVNRRPLAENLALLPRGIIKNLYPDAFGDEVGRRSSEMDIDKKFVLSVMKAESSFNNRAVSPAGAVGLMQIMPSTGKGIARELNIADFDLTIPQTSIYFGVKYIAWLKKIFNNDFDDIVAGYNAGAGNVKKWKKSINTDDRDYYIENIPFDETRHYILRTRKNYYIYNFLQSGKGF
jgi:tetratricopeptide (TPR) repeat protein